jgi:hypothetical protein
MSKTILVVVAIALVSLGAPASAFALCYGEAMRCAPAKQTAPKPTEKAPHTRVVAPPKPDDK